MEHGFIDAQGFSNRIPRKTLAWLDFWLTRASRTALDELETIKMKLLQERNCRVNFKQQIKPNFFAVEVL